MGWMIRRVVVFSVVCGLLITPLDSLQVGLGVETPAAHPWIITIQFAVVGAVIAVLSRVIDPKPKREPLRDLVVSGALFVAGYVCTAPQAKGVASTTFVYFLLLLSVMGFRAHGRGILRETLLFSVLLAATGTLTEILYIHLGGFEYHAPTILGVPPWLPFEYAAAGPLVRGLAAETTRPLPAGSYSG